MHQARGFFVKSLLWAAALCAGIGLAQATTVTSLYVVMVPSADPAQAAQQAMRVELVRLTGTRAAASDPALEALIDNARMYVQLERGTTTGQIQVLFDEPMLSAAISAAGRILWGTDRPLVWIQLPAQDAATMATLRMRLGTAAQERGLPISIVQAAAQAPAGVSTAPAGTATPAVPGAQNSAPAGTSPAPPPSAPSATSAPPASAPPAAAPPGSSPPAPTAPPAPSSVGVPAAGPLNPQAALDAARSAGASAALVAQAMPGPASAAASLQWTLVAANTSGQWVGGPEFAIDNATDVLSSAARALEQAPVAQYDCQIVGVADLGSLVNVLMAVRSAPGVSDVAVSDVSGDALTLRVQARGSGEELERALASNRLQASGPGTNGLLEYRYLPMP